jgi:hypothetical protein
VTQRGFEPENNGLTEFAAETPNVINDRMIGSPAWTSNLSRIRGYTEINNQVTLRDTEPAGIGEARQQENAVHDGHCDQ